jgi:hypothetical protein
MNGPVGVAVSIPARDEQETIAVTVRGVVRALRRALAEGLVAEAVLDVVAHRCSDDTATVAHAAATAAVDAAGQDVRVHVHRDDHSNAIGRVRDCAARRTLARLSTPAQASWLICTDGDSVVDDDWVTTILMEAAEAGASAVVGLAHLDGWRGTAAGQAAYDDLLRAKMRDTSGLHQHDHVYGANLAVRADAYLEVGGFPHVSHGEDQQLVDTLAARGHRVLRSQTVRVLTSGRFHGRAVGGLADHLKRLDAAASSTADAEAS